MKQEEKPNSEAKADDRKIDKEKVTAASIKNAHATGDGAVQKTDEILINDNPRKDSSDTNPY